MGMAAAKPSDSGRVGLEGSSLADSRSGAAREGQTAQAKEAVVLA